MTHPKDPRLNGWKYKSFNLNDKEHEAVVHMYETCSKITGMKQKKIKHLLHLKLKLNCLNILIL